MRYIDADKLIAHLKDEIEGCCEPHYGGRINGKSVAYGTVLGLKSAISFAETLSTADVIPKSWVEGWDVELAEEIFEEIEEALFNNHCVDDGTDYPIPHYFEELKNDIAELKKKYVTEKL